MDFFVLQTVWITYLACCNQPTMFVPAQSEVKALKAVQVMDGLQEVYWLSTSVYSTHDVMSHASYMAINIYISRYMHTVVIYMFPCHGFWRVYMNAWLLRYSHQREDRRSIGMHRGWWLSHSIVHRNDTPKYLYSIWLVVWNMWIFPYIGNAIIPTDYHIFQRGRSTTNQ